jgi:hypothetical protein
MGDPAIYMGKDEGHSHQWQNSAVIRQQHCLPSPHSTADDHIWDWVVQMQTCSCGATKRLVLGYENRRRRGDDARIARGLRPLGTPLSRSKTFAKPKRFPEDLR